MKLEAVWFKNKKEVYKVEPVMNIVCYDDMIDITEIEVYDGTDWHSCEDFNVEVDNFIIRIKRD